MAIGAVTNLMLSYAWVYWAPYGEALPSNDSIEFGEAWGGNWTRLGWTKSAVKMSYAQDIIGYEVEQVLSPILNRRQGEKASIETELAEIVGANLNLAVDGTLTTTNAGASVRATETLTVGGKIGITEYAWGMEGLVKNDGAAGNIPLPMRIFFYKGTAEINGALEFSRKALAGIPFKINAVADPSRAAGDQLMKIVRVTGKTTSEV